MKKSENAQKNESMNAPTVESNFDDVAFVKESNRRHKVISSELKKIDSSFEKIAFNLHWFQSNHAYVQLGYKNVVEFASREYNIAKGTVYNFINVVERFAERDSEGKILEKISENYKNFQSSKLIALLDVSDDKLDLFTPDMSVRDIKKTVRDIKESDKIYSGYDVEKEATHSSEADSPETEYTDVTISQPVNIQPVIRFSTLAEYNAYLDSMNDLIEKNLKSKAFKDGKHYIEICIGWTE